MPVDFGIQYNLVIMFFHYYGIQYNFVIMFFHYFSPFKIANLFTSNSKTTYIIMSITWTLYLSTDVCVDVNKMEIPLPTTKEVQLPGSDDIQPLNEDLPLNLTTGLRLIFTLPAPRIADVFEIKPQPRDDGLIPKSLDDVKFTVDVKATRESSPQRYPSVGPRVREKSKQGSVSKYNVVEYIVLNICQSLLIG